MKKILLIIIVFICTIKGYSQDSIVNYLDRKGKIVTKNNAVELETIVKKDTLWRVTKYFSNGKIKKQGHFKGKDKKNPVGKFMTFNRNGVISSMWFYDLKGRKKGNYISWFDKGSISFSGIYMNDLKEGIWKYYHYNGKEACKQYFKKDSLMKTILYNEIGNVTNNKLIEKRNPIFKGGQEKFKAKIRKLENDLSNLYDKVEGKIQVYFIVDVDGNIKDISVDKKIPKSLQSQIKYHFKRIKGWEPAIYMNRKIPIYYSIPLTFKTN
jgi:antitoxin component YwqK of YwqJK toxin-antitoxin module